MSNNRKSNGQFASNNIKDMSMKSNELKNQLKKEFEILENKKKNLINHRTSVEENIQDLMAEYSRLHRKAEEARLKELEEEALKEAEEEVAGFKFPEKYSDDLSEFWTMTFQTLNHAFAEDEYLHTMCETVRLADKATSAYAARKYGIVWPK